jgi:hypothetical protein
VLLTPFLYPNIFFITVFLIYRHILALIRKTKIHTPCVPISLPRGVFVTYLHWPHVPLHHYYWSLKSLFYSFLYYIHCFCKLNETVTFLIPIVYRFQFCVQWITCSPINSYDVFLSSTCAHHGELESDGYHLKSIWSVIQRDNCLRNCAFYIYQPVFLCVCVEVEVTLRLTVSQSVCLGIEYPCGTCDQILFPVGMLLSEICCLISVGRPLQTDGSAICSVISQWSESLRTFNHILLSHFRLPQPGRPDSRIYIPQEQGGPVIPPGTGLRVCIYIYICIYRYMYIYMWHPLSVKVDTNFADKPRLLSRYSLLADSGHGDFLYIRLVGEVSAYICGWRGVTYSAR